MDHPKDQPLCWVLDFQGFTCISLIPAPATSPAVNHLGPSTPEPGGIQWILKIDENCWFGKGNSFKEIVNYET